MSFDDYIKRITKQDAELLKNLGSDFDEDGVPYWEKWGTEAKFDDEFDVDTIPPNKVE